MTPVNIRFKWLTVIQNPWTQAINLPFRIWKHPATQSALAFFNGHPLPSDRLGHCPGYIASNVLWSTSSLRASLLLGGTACDAYGRDLLNLTFLVECQTEHRVHVQIFDPELEIYQVPEDVFPRPSASIYCQKSDLEVSIVEEPFSFSVRRKSDSVVIFDTAGKPLVFEDQYWRLRTTLPPETNLYGLGEHTDSLRLGPKSVTRTLWNRDAGNVPDGENLYGSHPVYFENRWTEAGSATHGIALINSNGMDIKLDESEAGERYLEYNVLGGIIDLHFLSGPRPFDVAEQYSDVSGKPAMMPYWAFGLHNCRFGYTSARELSEVVANYSLAEIPLETMWTDIDYMDAFKVFTLSPHFALRDMRDLVKHLHGHQQHYILMVDPAVAYQDYGSFNRGKDAGIFLRNATGQIYQAVVWPGLTAYPDWFHPNVQNYWSQEFGEFFDPANGIDIDGLWIDMNEPANFCEYPCSDPELQAASDLRKGILMRNDQLPMVDAPIPSAAASVVYISAVKKPMNGLPNRDLLNPKYKIRNHVGVLSNHTANTTVIHANGLAMYDTHNLFGTMMSTVSYNAMLQRRPSRRTMVITRSTFMGAGTRAGHWLGDNVATWHHYRQSIRHMLQFTAFFQMPMVGADICGFSGDTTEELCARWTRLGGFYPFMRNHNSENSIPQEFYRWPKVAEAARKAIDLRYRLIDYIYSALHIQTVKGTPLAYPLWMLYPDDRNTAAIELQFFYGPALLVSPVTEENASDVKLYMPNDTFYDLDTFERIQGNGSYISKHNVGITEIPVYIRGGYIIPTRITGANTTTELRDKHFNLIITLDEMNRASGFLYLDDGDSLVQNQTSEITFEYSDGVLSMNGKFDYPTSLQIVSARVLGSNDWPMGSHPTIALGWPLTDSARMRIP